MTVDGSHISAEGPNTALTTPYVNAVYCDTRTSAWKHAVRTGDYPGGSVTVNGPHIEILLRGDYPGDSSHTIAYYRLPEARAGVRLKATCYRNTFRLGIKLHYGTYAPQDDGDVVSSWTTRVLRESGSGSYGSFTIDETVADSCDVLAVSAYSTYSATDIFARLSQVRVYAEGTDDPTPATIIRGMVESGPDWLAHRDAGRYDAAIGAAIEPFVGLVEDKHVPLDLITQVLRYYDSRFQWLPGRAANVAGMVPVYDVAETDPAYLLDLRDPHVDAAGFGGLDVNDSASHVLVAYKHPDGSAAYTTVAAGTGYLDAWGYERWMATSTDTTSETEAQRIGDLAAQRAATDRHAGQVTTPYLLNAVGARVPVEHARCGARIRLLGYDTQVSPRLTELTVEAGRGTLTLDTAPRALDIALARQELRGS